MVNLLNNVLNAALNLLTLAFFPECKVSADPMLDLMLSDAYDIAGGA